MNQDFFYGTDLPIGRLPNLFLVADGMGGHRAGDYASRFSVDRIVAAVTRDERDIPVKVIKDAISKANTLLLKDAADDPDKYGMGTTLVGAVIYEDYLLAFNIGDSRLYLVSDTIRQITRDHSLVDEMVRMGELDEAEARVHPHKNIITRAIGAAEQVEPDFFEVETAPNEYVLLCTDGLTNMVSDAEICRIIGQDMSLEDKARKLVQTANANGGRDNITVMLIKPHYN